MSRRYAAGRDAAADAARWMRAGREDLFLAAFERHSEAWSRDPFLLLQRGVALYRVDRLRESEAAFRRAMALRSTSQAQKDWAAGWLKEIDRAWRDVNAARAALGRARWLGASTVVCGAALLWLLGRRIRVGRTNHDR